MQYVSSDTTITGNNSSINLPSIMLSSSFLLGPEHRRWEALLKLVRFFLLLLFRLFEGLFEGFNMLKKLGNFAEN